jgi:hypothetical protein
MSILINIEVPFAQSVDVSDDTLTVELSDGRTIMIPLTWYPRLLHGTNLERKNFRLIGKGYGIHWEDLDEDISVSGLLAGRSSQENPNSLKKWISKRNKKAA